MAGAKARKTCRICGAPADGKGDLCAGCTGLQRPPTPATVRRIGEKVKERLEAGEVGEFVCPYCRAELNWQTVGTTETEVTIYVREKIYFCPSCRAFLGVSSWHTEG
jgi:hypothetical protein